MVTVCVPIHTIITFNKIKIHNTFKDVAIGPAGLILAGISKAIIVCIISIPRQLKNLLTCIDHSSIQFRGIKQIRTYTHSHTHARTYYTVDRQTDRQTDRPDGMLVHCSSSEVVPALTSCTLVGAGGISVSKNHKSLQHTCSNNVAMDTTCNLIYHPCLHALLITIATTLHKIHYSIYRNMW